MAQYSPAVALFDFLPVAACAGALAGLAMGIAARRPALAPLAWAGALLVPLGGLCKASWKLLIALGEPPLAWLENLLFVAMAPGFAALALALHHAARGARDARALPAARVLAWTALPLVVAATLALSVPGRAWFAWLIAVTTIANGALVVHAIRASTAAGLRWPAACFAVSFTATLALAGLARLPQGEAAAWTQEAVNLAAQVALAAGAWKLSRMLRATAARRSP